MAPRVVKKTYRNTKAKGERRLIEGDRYLIRIDLVSLKPVERSDLDFTSEFYFRVGKMRHRVRTPAKGTFDLEVNEVLKPSDAITLYVETIKKKGGGTIEIPFKLYERDPLMADKEVVDTVVSAKLGQGGEYLMFDEKGVRCKIRVSANKTNW